VFGIEIIIAVYCYYFIGIIVVVVVEDSLRLCPVLLSTQEYGFLTKYCWESESIKPVTAVN